MKRSMFVLTIILLLSLVMANTAMADNETERPAWKVAFDPVPQLGRDAETGPVVEFNENLYFVFGGLDTADQVWGTPDGENWSLAWDATSITPTLEYIGPMEVFEDQLYLVIGDWDEELANRIMRTSDGENWEEVAIAPVSEGQVVSFGIFASFNGALYATVNYDASGVLESHLWRSISGDPDTWEDVEQFPWWIADFTEFKGALYAASDFYDSAQIYRSTDGENWEPVTTDGFGDPLNVASINFGEKDGYLYVSMFSWENGGDIWRSSSGDPGSWEAVTTDGLGDARNAGFTFVTYGEYLYAFSVVWWGGCIAYRSEDGLNWEIINFPGWGVWDNWAVARDEDRVIYKGDLYVSPAGPAGILRLSSAEIKDPWEVAFDPVPELGSRAETASFVEFNENLYFAYMDVLDHVDQVWGTPDGGNWSLAWDATSIQPGFEGIGYMTLFEDQLYLAINDGERELADRIMRTSDGESWEEVAIAPVSEEQWASFGFFTSFEGALYSAVNYDVDGVIESHLWRSISGDPGTWEDVAQFPWLVAAFADFKGALYVNSDLYDSAQIYRSIDGENWEPVTTDGFGDPSNVNSANFGEKDGYLYVSMGSDETAGDIWRSSSGDPGSWEAVTTDGLGEDANHTFAFVSYGNYLYAFSWNYPEGSIVYRSEDGLHWEIMNEPGWGDFSNSAIWVGVVFDDALYVSPYGPAGILRLRQEVKVYLPAVMRAAPVSPEWIDWR